MALAWEWNGRHLNLATQSKLFRSLRMYGDMPRLLIHVFMSFVVVNHAQVCEILGYLNRDAEGFTVWKQIPDTDWGMCRKEWIALAVSISWQFSKTKTTLKMNSEISSETFSILNIAISLKMESSLSAGTWKLYRSAHTLLQSLASSLTNSSHLQM